MRTLLIACFFLSGCGPILAGSGVAGVGIYLGYQHSKSGGIVYRFKNFAQQSKVKIIWADSKLDEPFLKIYAVNGVPVIIGAAVSQEGLEQAKALAFMKNDNAQSIAEVGINGDWNIDLEHKIRLRILRSLQVSGRNYHVKAIKGTVWLVGVASTQREKDKIIEIIEKTDGVAVLRHHVIVFEDSFVQGSVERIEASD